MSTINQSPNVNPRLRSLHRKMGGNNGKLRVLSVHARANRSRWEILRDVLEVCNGNSGVCLTTIMRKANLNSLYAVHCIEILAKSNLLRVIKQPIGNPRQNNNTKPYPRYVKTPEGEAFLDLFEKIQKMVMNHNENSKYLLPHATPKKPMSCLLSLYEKHEPG